MIREGRNLKPHGGEVRVMRRSGGDRGIWGVREGWGDYRNKA